MRFRTFEQRVGRVAFFYIRRPGRSGSTASGLFGSASRAACVGSVFVSGVLETHLPKVFRGARELMVAPFGEAMGGAALGVEGHEAQVVARPHCVRAFHAEQGAESRPHEFERVGGEVVIAGYRESFGRLPKPGLQGLAHDVPPRQDEFHPAQGLHREDWLREKRIVGAYDDAPAFPTG